MLGREVLDKTDSTSEVVDESISIEIVDARSQLSCASFKRGDRGWAGTTRDVESALKSMM